MLLQVLSCLPFSASSAAEAHKHLAAAWLQARPKRLASIGSAGIKAATPEPGTLSCFLLLFLSCHVGWACCSQAWLSYLQQHLLVGWRHVLQSLRLQFTVLSSHSRTPGDPFLLDLPYQSSLHIYTLHCILVPYHLRPCHVVGNEILQQHVGPENSSLVKV